MARIAAVTYEQVASLANALYAQGNPNPGTAAIREELAKRVGPGGAVGSPNTIQRHLDQWRLKDRPIDKAETPQLPGQLAADILRALNAASAVGREKAEERLVQVQAELDELATLGEANEARIDELAQDLASRTSERDSMAGQLAERTAEVATLKAALATAQERAAALEREKLAAQAEAQAANGRVDEIRQATERQLMKMQSDLDGARASQVEIERRAIDAEKRLAGADARLEGERSARASLEGQVAELQSAVKRQESDAARAAAAEAAAAGLRQQVQLLNETVTMLRGMLPTPEGQHPEPTASAGKTKK